MCIFPVDSEAILLLGRQNPALTHFQFLIIEWFIRQTGIVHTKMNIFSSCFSVLVIDPILGILYQEENAGSFLGLRPSMGPFLSLTFSC